MTQNEDLVIIPGVEKKTFLLFIELVTKGELTNLSLKDLNDVNELASFLGVNNIKVYLKEANSLEQPSIKEPHVPSEMPTAQTTVLTTDRKTEFRSIPDNQKNLSVSDKTSMPCSPVYGLFQGNGDGSQTIPQRRTTLDDSNENNMSENSKTIRDVAVTDSRVNVYLKEPLNESTVGTLSKAHVKPPEKSAQTTSGVPEFNVLDENLRPATMGIIPDSVQGNVFEQCSPIESPLQENIDGPGSIQNVSAPDDTKENVLTSESTQPVLHSIQNSESVAPHPIPQLNENKFDISNNIPDNFSMTASSSKVSSEINSPCQTLAIKEEVIDLTLDDSEESGSRWKGNKPMHQERPRANKAGELGKSEDMKEANIRLQPNKKANLQKDFMRCSVILERIRDIKRKREAKKNEQETATKRSERLEDERRDKETKSKLINEMLKKYKKKKKSSNNSLSKQPPEKQPVVSSSTDCLIEYESIHTGRKRKRDSSEESDFFWLRPSKSSESSLSEDTADRS